MIAGDITAERAAPSSTSARADATRPVELVGTGFAPQTIGGLYDAAFDIYKQHFSTLALIVACVFIPTQVALNAIANVWLKPLAAQGAGPDADPMAGVQMFFLALLIGSPQFGVPGYVSLLTSFMASGPIAVAVGNILVGRPLSVGAAYRRAMPVLRRLFWSWNLLLIALGVAGFVTSMVFSIVLVFVSFAGVAAFAPELITIIMVAVAFIAAAGVSTLMFALAPPLIALENLSVGAAVERNLRLVRHRSFWRVCLSVGLLPIVTFGLQALVLMSAGSVVGALKWPAWAIFVVNTGLSSFISFFFQPYWMIFITLLYFDLRARHEALDVRYLADNLVELDPLLGPPGATEAAIAAASAAPYNAAWNTAGVLYERLPQNPQAPS